MPSLNFRNMKQARWRDKCKAEFRLAMEGMTQQYTLDSLYPEKAIEEPRGSGMYVDVKQAMPHQHLYHDGIPPSERKKAAEDPTYKPKSAKFVLFNGAVGSGKSIAGAVDLLNTLRRYPGCIIYVTTAVDWYFDFFFLPTLRSILPDESPLIKKMWVKTRKYEMVNGSTFTMKAFDEPDKIKGFEMHRGYIFEASVIGDGDNDKAEAIFNAFCERLRSPGRQYDPIRKVVMDQNPKGHNWVWKKFIQPSGLGDRGVPQMMNPDRFYEQAWELREWEHSVGGDTYYCISTGTRANPFNPKGYVETMLANRAGDPGMAARMIEGHFDPVQSLVYGPEYFSKATHLIPIEAVCDEWDLPIYHPDDPRLDIPRDWPLIIGIDSAGNSSPWAIEGYVETPPDAWGKTHYIGMYEIYVQGYGWSEMAQLIEDMAEGWDSVEYWIDPYHSPQRSGPDGQCIFDEFTNRGIPVQKPQGYRRFSMAMRVRELLKPDVRHPCPYIPDYTEEDEKLTSYGMYKIGCARLYYAGFHTTTGIEAYQKMNLKEKEVYRFLDPKVRQNKESEEGLSKLGPEEIVGRDVHAQTAEHFAFLGRNPLPPPRSGSGRKRFDDKTKDRPVIKVGGHSVRRNRF